MSDDPFEAIKATFFQECEELLGDLETNLLALESGDTDIETINACFRAVHSVKGGAGAFGLEDLVRFAHVFETLMDELRSGRKDIDETVVRTLLRASDVLNDHVSAARGTGAAVDPDRSHALVVELETLTHGAPVSAAPTEGGSTTSDLDGDDFGFVPVSLSLDDFGASDDMPALPDLPPLDLNDLIPLDEPKAASGGWKIIFRPHPRLYANANETGLLLRELSRLGPTRVEVDDSGLPMLDALEPLESHLIWTIHLDAPVDEADVRDVFDFVETDCDLNITRIEAEGGFGGGDDNGGGLPELPALEEPMGSEADLAALVALAQADTAERLGGGKKAEAPAAPVANLAAATAAAAPANAPVAPVAAPAQAANAPQAAAVK